MKKLLTKITFILLVLVTLQAKAQRFNLSVQLKGVADAPLYIRYTGIDGKPIKDSATVQNGRLAIKGGINGPSMAFLYVSAKSSKANSGKWQNGVEIFLEPTTIRGTGSFDDLPTLKIEGSQSHKDYETFRELFKPTQQAMDAIQDKYLSNQAEYIKIMKIDKYDVRLKMIGHAMDSLNDILVANNTKMEKKFIAENSNSYVSAYLLYSNKTRWKPGDVADIYKTLGSDAQNSYYGKQVQSVIAGIQNNSGGKRAKNFTSTNIKGKKITLNDLKGKYVLLDFWGSWCAPCRESTPHIKQLYTKYNKLGFDVIAIAVQDTPKDWKEAIEHDGTSIWHNIMDKKSTTKTKAIVDDYSVHVFPTKILVKDGFIVGRYDGSATTALDKKLAEIFGKN